MQWELSLPVTLIVLLGYAAVMGALTWRQMRHTDAEAFVVADRDVGSWRGVATMSATWIWAASLYAAATAAYTYGLSGAFHYAFWGGLALLFVWRYGLRLRQMVPAGHTFTEFIRVRHGRLSQGVIGAENYLNSQYSMVLNFTAGAALLSLVSPLSYEAALVLVAAIVLGYSLFSGIRASIATDAVQMAAILVITVVVVPVVIWRAGGPVELAAALPALGDERATFWSLPAFLGQGAPMMALILAYAFANPTVWQRVWALRERDLGRIYVRSGLVYMVIVASVGTLGLVALLSGIEPADGDLNTLVPLVAGTYLPAWLGLGFVLLVIAAITSTSDSDLSALSAIAMTDLWHGYVRPDADDTELKTVARAAMVVVTVIAVAVAMLRLDILTLILFYGMIRSASVVPIAASIVWDRVSNVGFSTGILTGVALGIGARWWATPDADGIAAVSAGGIAATALVVLAVLGAGSMAACLAYPLVRIRAAAAIGGLVAVAVAATQVVAYPGLLGYPVLLSTLVALGTGMVVCIGVSLLTDRSFDWAVLDRSIRPLGKSIAPAAGTTA
ncbi:sodium:solute symporter family protein [soil metagenome]